MTKRERFVRHMACLDYSPSRVSEQDAKDAVRFLMIYAFVCFSVLFMVFIFADSVYGRTLALAVVPLVVVVVVVVFALYRGFVWWLMNGCE